MKLEFQAMLQGKLSEFKTIHEVEQRLLEQGQNLTGIDKEKFLADCSRQMEYLRKKNKFSLKPSFKSKKTRVVHIVIDGICYTQTVSLYQRAVQVETPRGIVTVRIR